MSISTDISTKKKIDLKKILDRSMSLVPTTIIINSLIRVLTRAAPGGFSRILNAKLNVDVRRRRRRRQLARLLARTSFENRTLAAVSTVQKMRTCTRQVATHPSVRGRYELSILTSSRRQRKCGRLQY